MSQSATTATAPTTAAAPINEAGAHSLLADVGFLLVPGPPLDRGAAYLLVAMRPRPTRAHYDPERIEYWTVDNGLAQRHELVWPMRAMSAGHAWGAIRIVDRLGARNQFISFGGELSVSRDGPIHAALFRSDAPILALGGHSVSAEPLAVKVSGYFAKLRARAGWDPKFASELASASPVAVYGAFIEHELQHVNNVAVADSASPHIQSLLRCERRRLAIGSPTEALVAVELDTRLRAAA